MKASIFFFTHIAVTRKRKFRCGFIFPNIGLIRNLKRSFKYWSCSIQSNSGRRPRPPLLSDNFLSSRMFDRFISDSYFISIVTGIFPATTIKAIRSFSGRVVSNSRFFVKVSRSKIQFLISFRGSLVYFSFSFGCVGSSLLCMGFL